MSIIIKSWYNTPKLLKYELCLHYIIVLMMKIFFKNKSVIRTICCALPGHGELGRGDRINRIRQNTTHTFVLFIMFTKTKIYHI